jgi:hypothetical protein
MGNITTLIKTMTNTMTKTMTSVTNNLFKCGVRKCNYNAKNYGVCGVHKKWAWRSSDARFCNDLKQYEILAKRLDKLLYELDDPKSVVCVQKYWAPDDETEPDLTRPPCREFPPEYQRVGYTLAEMLRMFHDMSSKYDETLVHNACLKIRHSFYECECDVCLLG